MVHPNSAITISRQTGSGGAHLGFLVARALGFRYLNREIILQAARKLNRAVESLQAQEERPVGMLDRIIQGLAVVGPDMPYVPSEFLPVYSKDIFEAECRIMRNCLESSSAVIVGRGGFAALRDRPDTLHVFVHAPLEFRIQRLMEDPRVPNREEAIKRLKESDHSRQAFIKEVAGAHWEDASNFDLCLDTCRLGIETSLDLIVAAFDGLCRSHEVAPA